MKIVPSVHTGRVWGDLLTSYNGNTITYDEIGNPLSDGTWSYTWQRGRQLAAMSNGTTTWNFSYNSDGLRTQKTNGTKTYSYVYNGSSLSQMTVGKDTLRFFYDASGLPVSVTFNGTTYYYATNIQGDVTAILDSTGTTVVEYTYDAWGKPLTMTGTLASTLGQTNPLCYRGYIYDQEIGLYYNQTRYYNPVIGRFINSDVYASSRQGLSGYNMNIYCLNNPVKYGDYTGLDAIVLYDDGFPGHIGALVQDEDGNWWHFYWGAEGAGTSGSSSNLWDGKSVAWCKRYVGELTLEGINNSKQYGGNYEDMIYLTGDFSTAVNAMKKLEKDSKSSNGDWKYNLITKNCSQMTIGLLMGATPEPAVHSTFALLTPLPALAKVSIKVRTGQASFSERIAFSLIAVVFPVVAWS